MTMLIVGLSVTYRVLRLIRICPALWAPPGIVGFFKLLLQQPISDTPILLSIS